MDGMETAAPALSQSHLNVRSLSCHQSSGHQSAHGKSKVLIIHDEKFAFARKFSASPQIRDPSSGVLKVTIIAYS